MFLSIKTLLLIITILLISGCGPKYKGYWCRYQETSTIVVLLNKDHTESQKNKISQVINKFEDIYTSLAAYNAGETRVRSWLKSNEFSSDSKTLLNIPYVETKNYVKKIKNNINFYKKIYKY